MEKFFSWFSGLPTDKKDHAFLGMVGSLTLATILSIKLPILWAVFLTFLLLVFIAWYKEYKYDAARPNHTVDPKDMAVTIAGGTFGLLCLIVITL